LGFSIQSEVALLYHLVPIGLWLISERHRLARKDFWNFGVSLTLVLLPMILSEIKFGFQGVVGIVYLLTGEDDIVKSLEFSQIVLTYINQVGKTFAYTLFPLSVGFGGLLGLFAILYSVSKLKTYLRTRAKVAWQAFLLSAILIHIVALPFGGSNMRHIMVGASGLISVFAGIFLWKYLGQSRVLLFLVTILILVSNVIKIVKENRWGQTIFPLQKDLTLTTELAAVDYTYQSSGGERFSINTTTSPLFVNTLWSYLYNWYGFKKYNVLPYWTGRDQVGQLGNNLLYPQKDEMRIHYYIIEPTYGIPDQYLLYGQGEEDSKSKLVEEKKFGTLVVQKRFTVN